MVLWENLFISLHNYSYIKTLLLLSELPFFLQLQVIFNLWTDKEWNLQHFL